MRSLEEISARELAKKVVSDLKRLPTSNLVIDNVLFLSTVDEPARFTRLRFNLVENKKKEIIKLLVSYGIPSHMIIVKSGKIEVAETGKVFLLIEWTPESGYLFVHGEFGTKRGFNEIQVQKILKELGEMIIREEDWEKIDGMLYHFIRF